MKEIDRDEENQLQLMRLELAELQLRMEGLSHELFKKVRGTYKPLVGTKWENRKTGKIETVHYILVDSVGIEAMVRDGSAFQPVIIWADDSSCRSVSMSNLTKSFKRVK